MKRFIITLLMTLLLIGQAFFLGLSDKMSLILVIITVVLLFIVLNRLQSQSKKTLRVSTKKDGFLYSFLSKEPHFIIKIWILVISIIFSFVLVLLLKGMVITHGYIAPLLFIVITCAVLYSFINTEYRSKTVDDNLQEDIASHGNEMLRLISAAIIINFILAFGLSANDAHLLYNSNITVDNFIDYAIENQIIRQDGNYYTRVPLNVYILAESARMALTREIIEHFEFLKSFYLFYLFSFIFNLFKLTIFSFSIVLLQRSLDKRVHSIILMVNKIYILAQNSFNFTNEKIKSVYQNKKIEKEEDSDEPGQKVNN